MNDLSRDILEAAWDKLSKNQQTPEWLASKADEIWACWRNKLIDDSAEQVMPYVRRRPATDYYPETPAGAKCLDWLDEQGFYWWETPVYDGEEGDNDFVYHFFAYYLAVRAWLCFEPDMPHLDYTEAELEEFFNFKKAYAPPVTKSNQRQLSMF